MANAHPRLVLIAALALLLLAQPYARLAAAQYEEDGDDLDLADDDDGDFGLDDDEADDFPPEDDGGDYPGPEGEDQLPPEDDLEEGQLGEEEDEADAIPEGDDGDVVAVTAETLPDLLARSKYVLLEFYAPWCGHCKNLAPEFRAAAEKLKEYGVALAKVDATKHEQLASEYSVDGFPTLVWFANNTTKTYSGGRLEASIVAWVKKRVGFSVTTLATVEEASKAREELLVLAAAFFPSLESADAAAFAAAGMEVEGADFVQTDSVDVAKALGLSVDGTKPSVAVVKGEEEMFVAHDGALTKDELVAFVDSNKRPLFVVFDEETASTIFGGEVKIQVFVFAPAESYDLVASMLKPVAKPYLGRVIFVYMNGSDESLENAREFFNVNKEDTTVVALNAEKKQDGEKFFMKGEVNKDSIKTFVDDLIAGKLEAFFKSDPIPEKNDGPVKVVVGNSFVSIVLDPTKDVMLEVYAPWCGHCKALAPVYKKLGKKFKGVDSVVIAKMDGTTNEYPGINVEGFPTILFYPANDKANPIPVSADRQLKPLIAFIKKHASIPFELSSKLSPEEKEAQAENAEAEEEAAAAAAGGKEEL